VARRTRRRALSRWLAGAALALTAFLYWKPIHAYLHVRSEVAQRQAEVRSLAAQRRTLLRRLAATTSADALEREARQLGFVRAGEHLYIVKGIPAWRRHRKATIGRHG
jgi:cell division protein FtsB